MGDLADWRFLSGGLLAQGYKPAEIADLGILQAVYILESHYLAGRRGRLDFLADVSVAVWGDKKAREQHIKALNDGQ